VAIGVILASLIIWVSRPAPTCFDDKKNQGEEGVDCGGPCEIACLETAQLPVVLWVRIFKAPGNFFDTASLVDNPNVLFGSSELTYRFRIYDANNILVSIREGKTFVNPGERFIIFESGIDAGERIPQRATVEFDKIIWRRVEKEKPILKVVRKDFVNLPFPRLFVEVENTSILDVKDVYLSAVLFDEEGNAVASSQTKIDFLKAERSQGAVFTWPRSFEKPPASSEVFIRARLVP
jgi:hypothetical protein